MQNSTQLQPVVLIAGYTASGKTTLASRLADSLGFAFVDVGSIVRTAALDAVSRGADLLNTTQVSQYADALQLHQNFDRNGLQIYANGNLVDYTAPDLRQSYLDTETLLLAQAVRTPLRAFQREIATVTPTVFSVRNGRAFTPEESVRIFIDPGMTTRIRRRARTEFGIGYENLDREQKRDVIQRVVIKEGENAENGTAMYLQEIAEEGFTIYQNKHKPAQSLNELKDLTIHLLQEKYPILYGYEGNKLLSNKER
ncbi:MAG: (d)CMP kinase [Patescibacteria group bacterium]